MTVHVVLPVDSQKGNYFAVNWNDLLNRFSETVIKSICNVQLIYHTFYHETELMCGHYIDKDEKSILIIILEGKKLFQYFA